MTPLEKLHAMWVRLGSLKFTDAERRKIHDYMLAERDRLEQETDVRPAKGPPEPYLIPPSPTEGIGPRRKRSARRA